jgi:hypothetical protein
VTAKPRHTEVHQYYRSAKNRLVLLLLACF